MTELAPAPHFWDATIREKFYIYHSFARASRKVNPGLLSDVLRGNMGLKTDKKVYDFIIKNRGKFHGKGFSND